MKYHRPETIEDAIKLLAEGVPLAGGTTLAPKRRTLEAVIDLDGLGMDQIEVGSDQVRIGAATKLQALVDPDLALTEDLIHACRLEAAWNLRNMATVAGTIMAADGRSPLLLVLLALKAEISIHGENTNTSLDEMLNRRLEGGKPFLITEITFAQPAELCYEYVARAPTDRPLVSAAAASPARGGGLVVAIGGFGDRPVLLENGNAGSMDDLKRQAVECYAQAGDAFASAEYRSEVAGILVERVLKEVQV
jgi:CO/xanthine dehydrogenase FAD-binding subunit